jgi:hypothetical protein
VVYDGQRPLASVLWRNCVGVLAILAKVHFVLLAARVACSELLVGAVLEPVGALARGCGAYRTVSSVHELVEEAVSTGLGDARLQVRDKGLENRAWAPKCSAPPFCL